MKALVAMVAAVALFAGSILYAGSAQAQPQRYQFTYQTLQVTVNGTYVHTYNLTISPCDNSVTGTGTVTDTNGNVIHETLTGNLTNGTLNLKASYNGQNYSFTFSVPATGAGPFTTTGAGTGGQSLSLSVSRTATSMSNYKNHGQYVSSQPQGERSTAAHSCIGMPVQSHKSSSVKTHKGKHKGKGH